METDLERIKRDHNIVDELARRGIGPVRSYGRQVTYRCPLPGHDDTEPSFTVYTDENRFKCYGCDRHGSIIDLIAELDGRDTKEVIRELMPERGGGGTPAGNGAKAQQSTDASASHEAEVGCTVERLAEKCGLRPELLESFGVADFSYLKKPAVHIPYRDADGKELAVQIRRALDKDQMENRFAWRKGSKPTLYGWPSLREAKGAGHIIICEGCTDYWTLRHHKLPALALPSSTGWKEQYAEALADFPVIYVVIEPDEGGQTVRQSFEKSQLRDRVKLIYMSEEAKDPNELHKKDPANFPATFERLMREAVPLTEELQKKQSAEAAEAWERCKDLAHDPVILDRFIDSLHSRGLAGEDRLSRLLYLALCSRFFNRPVSVAVKGPSSGGKSFIVERVLDYFPESAYFSLSAMSDRALAYLEEPLVHRFLVLYEAAGIRGEIATYLIRSLLSEGCIRYATVESTEKGLHDKVITHEGPTGLILTTTKASLHPENETRMLSLTVTDTQEQTREVFRAIADEAEYDDTDGLEEWRALQVWLDMGGDHVVTVPFSGKLAELVPAVAVRLRRDFSTILSLVRAHALLHQVSRARDEHGRIIATIEDYTVVRDLVAEQMADEVGATLSKATKETVEAVRALGGIGTAGVSNRQVAEYLEIDPASASRRLKVAAEKGYLQNLQTKRGVAAKWVLDDEVSEEQELLPAPEALDPCIDAPLQEEEDDPPSGPAGSVLV